MILLAIVGIGIILVSSIYMLQEKMIFFPEKLPESHNFAFPGQFEERWFQVDEKVKLHGLHFRSDSSKGLIFYLHGNAGSLDSWGGIAPVYTNLGWDLFVLDYRGFGKSQGRIQSEKQFHQDIQTTYDQLKTEYPEKKIVVIGYSIGSGPAARLAAHNQPAYLILQAPYYSLVDLTKNIYPIVPGGLLKYKFPTHQFLEEVKAPVTLFHGYEDEVIYFGSSMKLKRHLKPSDELITLQRQGHNGMNEDPAYRKAIAERLSLIK